MISEALIVLSLPLLYLHYLQGNIYSKVAPVAALTLATFAQSTTFALSAGMIMTICLVGDIFLALDDTSESNSYFLFGLVTFLFAQSGFAQLFYEEINHSIYLTLPSIGIFFLYLMNRIIFKVEESMQVPVVIYGLVICSMGFFAINRFYTQKSTYFGRLFVVFAALFFILSDALLAIDRFDISLGEASFSIFITYYMGLFFIALSAYADNPGPPLKKADKQA
jgi:uncharacterized membrane protein YhhN